MKYLIILLILIGCTKEPCDCGQVISSEFNGRTWTTQIDYCGEVETMLMFDYKAPGTILCKLEETELKPCKP